MKQRPTVRPELALSDLSEVFRPPVHYSAGKEAIWVSFSASVGCRAFDGSSGMVDIIREPFLEVPASIPAICLFR